MRSVICVLVAGLGLAAAFVPGGISRHAVAQSTRSSSASTVTMARNPLKSLKVRTIRTKNVENGRLRLNVFRSNNHIYGQIINDVEHHTLAAASTKSLKLTKGSDTEAAKAAGKALGDLCKTKGIEKLFFDRQSAAHKYTYHGRVEAFVDGVREGGVEL